MELNRVYSLQHDYHNQPLDESNLNYIRTKNFMAKRILQQQDELDFLNQLVFYEQIKEVNLLELENINDILNLKDLDNLELNDQINKLTLNNIEMENKYEVVDFKNTSVSEEEAMLLKELNSLKEDDLYLTMRLNKLSTDRYLLKNELKELINSLKQIDIKELNNFICKNNSLLKGRIGELVVPNESEKPINSQTAKNIKPKEELFKEKDAFPTMELDSYVKIITDFEIEESLPKQYYSLP